MRSRARIFNGCATTAATTTPPRTIPRAILPTARLSAALPCDGYTGAYNLLLKLEGIECTSLFNDSHIWTLATLDGTQYHIDVTWGDQYGRTDLRYFGMSEEQSYQYHPWNRKK